MDTIYFIKEVLEKSVEKNGETLLTNKQLLDIIKTAEDKARVAKILHEVQQILKDKNEKTENYFNRPTGGQSKINWRRMHIEDIK